MTIKLWRQSEIVYVDARLKQHKKLTHTLTYYHPTSLSSARKTLRYLVNNLHSFTKVLNSKVDLVCGKFRNDFSNGWNGTPWLEESSLEWNKLQPCSFGPWRVNEIFFGSVYCYSVPEKMRKISNNFFPVDQRQKCAIKIYIKTGVQEVKNTIIWCKFILAFFASTIFILHLHTHVHKEDIIF